VPIAPEPQPDADQAAQRTQYHLRVLDELVGMGTDIARKLHQQIIAAPPAPEPAAGASKPAPDPVIAFDRIARTIRHTIALSRKLAEPAKTPVAAQALAAQNRKHDVVRKRIIREVEDAQAIGRLAATISDEVLEHLETPNFVHGHDGTPIAEIIADICFDLGIDTAFGPIPSKPRKTKSRRKTGSDPP